MINLEVSNNRSEIATEGELSGSGQNRVVPGKPDSLCTAFLSFKLSHINESAKLFLVIYLGSQERVSPFRQRLYDELLSPHLFKLIW